MATLPESTRDMFRRHVREVVRQRDADGGISPRASIILHYRQLDQTERFAARLWIDGEIKGSTARLDMGAARAWIAVRDRIKDQ